MSGKPQVRCAIYTRKSSDEGLDQAFNSLDAQHEACAAYVASQRHEGWRLVSQRFDDGGLSGGTLERPALQRLLAEIDAGRIGMVVVYKIDRLTRSLADFVRLVERLEAKGCSFVSVTQSFNTSSSMGRLTLNVLLSFAQFEREVTAERIRDKIAASKKKGLWMGGILPLGYDRHPDPQRRELVVNAAEAETVRTLFRLYADLGNLREVEVEAARLGLRPKQVSYGSGRRRGDGPFRRGQLHYLLTNPVYLGQIRHRDKVWPGQHPALVEAALWTEVQDKLQANARKRRAGTPAARDRGAPLTGLLTDETGDCLTPTHTTKGGRQYRYYVSNRLIAGKPDPAAWRLPAAALEQAVAATIAGHLRAAQDRHAIAGRLEAPELKGLARRAELLADRVAAHPADAAALLKRGRLAAGTLTMSLDRKAVAAALTLAPDLIAQDLLTFAAPLELRRRGVEVRLVSVPGDLHRDPVLIRALARAREWADALRSDTTLAELARATGHAESYVRSRSHLAFLSPAIQDAILAGRQPADLTLERLLRLGIPLDWTEQARRLGFAA